MVWNCASIKPLDIESLTTLLQAPIFTIEEHSVLGGCVSAVAEVLSELPTAPRLHRLGIPDSFLHDTGEQHESRAYCGIDAAGITCAVETALR